MTIHEYFGDWCGVVNTDMVEHIMRQLAGSGQPVCPALRNVFRAFALCPLHGLKVVVLGQYPYSSVVNGSPVANGIALGCAKCVPKHRFPPELDVLTESVINFTVPHKRVIFDPALERWCQQGVLMLNSALTCLPGHPEAHASLWRPFIGSLLSRLSAFDTGIVYVLMGSMAQSFESCINPRFNHIIKVQHPSWYVHQHSKMPSDVWLQVNLILKGLYGSGIDWYNEL